MQSIHTTRNLLDIEPALNVSICLKLSTPLWRQDPARHAGAECPAGRMRMQMSRHAWSHVPTGSSSWTSITREHLWQVSCAYIPSMQSMICLDVHHKQCGAWVPIRCMVAAAWHPCDGILVRLCGSRCGLLMKPAVSCHVLQLESRFRSAFAKHVVGRGAQAASKLRQLRRELVLPWFEPPPQPLTGAQTSGRVLVWTLHERQLPALTLWLWYACRYAAARAAGRPRQPLHQHRRHSRALQAGRQQSRRASSVASARLQWQRVQLVRTLAWVI